MKIPSFVLKKLYVHGSLRATPDGVRFLLRNSLASASLTGLKTLHVQGEAVGAERVRLRIGGEEVRVDAVSPQKPLVFPRNEDAEVLVQAPMPQGRAKVRLEVASAEFGDLVIEFEDAPGPDGA